MDDVIVIGGGLAEGAAKVVTFLRNVLRMWPEDTRYEIRWLNGAPAILGRAERARASEPTRFVTRLDWAATAASARSTPSSRRRS